MFMPVIVPTTMVLLVFAVNHVFERVEIILPICEKILLYLAVSNFFFKNRKM